MQHRGRPEDQCFRALCDALLRRAMIVQRDSSTSDRFVEADMSAFGPHADTALSVTALSRSRARLG